MGIEELVVKHRLERGEIAAAHRRIALVLEGEDFLVAAHRQTSLAVSPGTLGLQLCLAPSVTRSPRRRCPGTRHSQNGIYGTSPALTGSLGLDVGRTDHLAPLLGFIGKQLAEVGR